MIPLPFLMHSSPDAIISVQNGQAMTCTQLLSYVYAVSKRLPDEKFVLNLCEDRFRFLISFGAALLKKQITLMPPGRSQKQLQDIKQAYGGCYEISDESISISGLPLLDGAQWLRTSSAERAIPHFSPDQPVAIAFTSGSTGQPQPHVKTWGALVSIAHKIGARLDLCDADQISIVATVPPQHMYGLETSIMLPLQQAGAVHAARPFFPEDIQKALSEIPAPRMLISTPLHIRACVAERSKFPPLSCLISATAPLSKSLAQQAEDLFETSVVEIYGFTEGGSVAVRRPVLSDQWELLDGLRLVTTTEGLAIAAPYFPEPFRVPDHISCISPTHFELLGRPAHLVNIAGRRASLDELNRELQEIPGVQDATFFMPEEREAADHVSRLVAFVVAPDKTVQDIFAILRTKIDPAFLPRPLFVVETLPRNDTGKLTRAALNALYRKVNSAKETSAGI